MFRNRYNRSRRGLTVVEIFLVGAAASLFLAIVWMLIANVHAQNRDRRRVEDMKVLKETLANYAANHAAYSPSGSAAKADCVVGAGCGHLISCGDQITGTSFLAQDLHRANLISTMPSDPLNPRFTPGPYNYYYASVGDHYTDYTISYCLETGSIDGKAKGINQVRP